MSTWPTWKSDDSGRAQRDLLRARAATLAGRHSEARELLRSLKRSTDRTISFRAHLQAALLAHRTGEVVASPRLEDFVKAQNDRPGGLSLALSLELARTWSRINRLDLAKETYRDVLERAADEHRNSPDLRLRRLVALAHYRLGQLLMNDGEVDDAYLHWRKAYDEREVSDVFPYVSYALASQIGRRRFPPERIELMYLHAVRSQHIALALQARLELVDFLALREQFQSARNHLNELLDQGDAAHRRKVADRLLQLDVEAAASAAWRPVHDAVELRRTSNNLIVDLLVKKLLKTKGRRVIIVGAGTGGRYLLDSLKQSDRRPVIVGFVDDDTRKIPPEGLPMLGDIDKLEAIIKREGVDEVLMAIPIAPGQRRLDVVKACWARKVPLRNLPSMHELIVGWDMEGPTLVNQLRTVRIEETIGDKEVRLDDDIVRWAQGSRILVIGAGGVGAEICRRLALGAVESLTVLDTDEHALDHLTTELSEKRGLHHVVPVLGDWLDESLLARELECHRPAVVIHTQGLVSSRVLERNPFPGAFRDVVGARTVADIAGTLRIPCLLYVSDVRAARVDSTPYGAFKALGEEAILSMQDQHLDTAYGVLRTTPPMGIPGSVLARVEGQIESGGPVIVPGPAAMARFLSMARTAELILHAVRLMEQQGLRGRLAVDSGSVENIARVAETMIRMRGYAPHIDIAVRFDSTPNRDAPIELCGESIRGCRELLRLPRSSHKNFVVDGLIRSLKGIPDDVDEKRTLAVRTLEFARTIPSFDDPPSALKLDLADPRSTPQF